MTIRRKLSTMVVSWVAVFGLVASQAWTQETTSGSITGKVVDEQDKPIPGASVEVASPQGTRTFVSDAGGRFFAPFLTPGRHSVKISLPGFATLEQKNIEVRLGQRIEVTFPLKVSGVQETMEVVGAAPVIDTSSTTAGGVIDSEVLKHLPVGRAFTDTLYMVPGVSDSSGVGRANPSVTGASGLENNYIVDGVNITNTGFGGVGTYSIVFGSLGTGVTTDFIQETQVKTAGFEAEYGQATGGVINLVTRTGTNNFHGSVFGYFRPDSLEGSYKELQTPNGTVNTTGQNNSDFGVTLGGPVMKDKLFFFGAFNPQYQSRSFIAPNDVSKFPLRSLGDVDRKRSIYSYAAKLTFQGSSKHRFDVSVFGDPSSGDIGPQRFTSLKAQTTTQFSELKKFGGHQQMLKYDGILAPSWLIEASVGRSTNTVEELPSVDEWAVTDRTVTPFRVTGGIGFYDQAGNGTNLQYQLKSTHLFDLGGRHQIRYGAAFEDIEFVRQFGRTGPPFTLADGTLTRTGASGVSIVADPTFGKIWRVARANFGPTPVTTQKYLSFFLQDTWQITDRLTVRPGLRWERQRLIGGDPPLCHEGDTRPGAGDGPGAAIPCEFTWDKNWAPRLGITYDVRGNGKSKIYANYGRFYAKIPNDLAARALSADAGISRADYFDAGLTRPIPNGTLAGGQTTHLIIAGLHASIFDPEAGSTYQDEFLAGFEYEVAPSVSLGARYIRRTMPQILEDIGQAAMVLYELPQFSAEVDYFITNVNARTPTVNMPGVPDAAFEDPVHTYDAVELTANKSFSGNWSLMASYRWARLKGNFEGFYRSDNGQSDPAITSLFDFPTNDPSYTQIGVPQYGFKGDIRYLGTTLGSGFLPNDRPHQLKVFGTYSLNKLNLGLGFNAGSGRSLTALAANPSYANAGEIPETLRGAGIQTVDGFKKRTQTEVLFDLHADYSVAVGGDRRVILLADVFNVLDRQSPTDYDNFTESQFTVANPNFGQPAAGGGSSAASYERPRSIRLGLRFEW